MEKIGIPKRSLFVKRVKAAQESQEEAKEVFASALDRYKSVVRFDGGNLEETYGKLSSELEAAESQAQTVRKRIDSIKDVSEALFDEWETELGSYSNAELRRSSERKMTTTRGKYTSLISKMDRAEAKLDPALQPLRDSVLYLKHNLNAKAVGALEGELVTLEGNVSNLLRDLDKSIVEADSFIREMEQAAPANS